MDNKKVKLTMIEKAIIISTFMAAVVIVYTAFWYVENSKVKEVAKDSKYCDVKYFYNSDDQILDGNINRSIGENKINIGIYKESVEYSKTEPIKIITKKCTQNNEQYETCKICYYSNEFRAQTAYNLYKSDFDDATIEGNVITFFCK